MFCGGGCSGDCAFALEFVVVASAGSGHGLLANAGSIQSVDEPARIAATRSVFLAGILIFTDDYEGWRGACGRDCRMSAKSDKPFFCGLRIRDSPPYGLRQTGLEFRSRCISSVPQLCACTAACSCELAISSTTASRAGIRAVAARILHAP